MNIIIKKMETDAEIRGKAYVHWKSWQEAYPGMICKEYLDGLTLEECEKTAYRWQDNILIAKDGERVIGFAGYGRYRNSELTNTGEIFALYVLAEYCGKGTGDQLMVAALDRLKEFPETAVWVLKDNKRAIRFYERWGFRRDGREEILHLGEPVTEIRMMRKQQETEE